MLRMRRFAALLVCVACVEGRVTEPAPASAAARPVEQPAVAPPASADAAPAIDADDRTCASDGDCTAILTQCSMCEGACTGVRVDRAARYDGKLDCSQYHGMVCNYDCRPRFAIEAPRCVAGRCESVRIR
jgi:hypothetical protein